MGFPSQIKMDSYKVAASSSSRSSPAASVANPVVEPDHHADKNSLLGELTGEDTDGHLGVLEIYIHQARDIQNICIYHKQDVYAKFCLTNDPEASVTTRTINGGGRSPVFDEKLHLKVTKMDSSLKCEIWMFSRAKNYLEDQLLGFSLVPTSEIAIANKKFNREYTLSSTDLFHSPAGFVELSLSYTGSSPGLPVIRSLPDSKFASFGSVESGGSIRDEYTKIEFPDPNIVDENRIMVTEYIGISHNSLDSNDSRILVTADNGNHVNMDDCDHAAESFSECSKPDTPSSSVPESSSCSSSTAVSVALSPLSDSQNNVSSQKKISTDARHSEASSSSDLSGTSYFKPLIDIKIEPDQHVVKQEEIVDMYMKSMQQFTESLAKMKLPLDLESRGSGSPNGSSDSDPKCASKGGRAKVFYGSSAFF